MTPSVICVNVPLPISLSAQRNVRFSQTRQASRQTNFSASAFVFDPALDHHPLELGDGRKNADDQIAKEAGRREGVAAEIDDVDDDPLLFEALESRFQVQHAAAQAIHFGDDQILHVRMKAKRTDQESPAVAFQEWQTTRRVFVGELQVVRNVQTLEPGVFDGFGGLGFERAVLLVGRNARVECSEIRCAQP